MARLRNVLVHPYLDVDPYKVYDALQNYLPDLETYAECIAQYILPESGENAESNQ